MVTTIFWLSLNFAVIYLMIKYELSKLNIQRELNNKDIVKFRVDLKNKRKISAP
jgi:hypothetical protein